MHVQRFGHGIIEQSSMYTSVTNCCKQFRCASVQGWNVPLVHVTETKDSDYVLRQPKQSYWHYNTQRKELTAWERLLYIRNSARYNLQTVRLLINRNWSFKTSDTYISFTRMTASNMKSCVRKEPGQMILERVSASIKHLT